MRGAAAKEKMQELEVDWDHIDTGYREEPAVLGTYYRDSMSPSSTMVSTPQVPSFVVDHKVIRKSMYSPALAPEINLSKPDGCDELIENPLKYNDTKQ